MKDVTPNKIPLEVVAHRLSEDERAYPQCVEPMRKIGAEVWETWKRIPAKAILHRDVYDTSTCEDCEKNDISKPIVKAPKKPTVIPGSFASLEAVTHIMVQKFVMYSPLYQQEQEWNRAGVMVSRQTMSNWVSCVAEEWLWPLSMSNCSSGRFCMRMRLPSRCSMALAGLKYCNKLFAWEERFKTSPQESKQSSV